MSRNPILNALAAIGYIVVVAFFMSLVPQIAPEPSSSLGPLVGILILFVFSAAVTSYLVVGMPLRLFLEGEKKEAVSLFMKTLAAFAVAGVILFVLLLLTLGW
jgi:hypothetical protein